MTERPSRRGDGDGGGAAAAAGSIAVCLGVTLWGCCVWACSTAAKDQQALAACAAVSAIRQPCLSLLRCITYCMYTPCGRLHTSTTATNTTIGTRCRRHQFVSTLPSPHARHGTFQSVPAIRDPRECHVTPIGVPDSFPVQNLTRLCASLVTRRRKSDKEGPSRANIAQQTTTGITGPIVNVNEGKNKINSISSLF